MSAPNLDTPAGLPPNSISLDGPRRGIARWLSPAGLLIILICTAFPGSIAPYSPVEIDPQSILVAPNRAHLLGTDANGMDILSRLIWATRIDITIAIVSTVIALSLGTLLGAWAGFEFGRPTVVGRLSNAFMRLVDAVQAFPVFVLALALVAILGRNIFNLIYVLVFVNTFMFLRLSRSSVISTREEAYVDSARMAGNSERRVLLRHVVPNIAAPSLVNASVVAGNAILLTAGLSFVGAGVPAPTAEWGSMVATGAQSLYLGKWWPALMPGLAIGVVVLVLASLGDTIRRRMDPTVDTIGSRPAIRRWRRREDR